MKSYTLFQQYSWLVNIIRRYRKISLDEINKHWVNASISNGQPLARSTFNRHRDAIFDMFGLIVDCDKKDGYCYYISNEEVLKEDSIQNWMLSTLSVNSILAESKSVHDRILLEKIPSDGDNLHHFIEAMERGVRVRVGYRKYGSDEVKEMLLEPYFVKLFSKRWYALVKYTEPDASLFTLAFDRIVSLHLTDEKYTYNAEFEPAAWFRDSYGIVRDNSVPVEKVVIRAYEKEINYLRDLPFHPSQKEVNTTPEYADFEMLLSPTPDFWTPLVARGPAIKILRPQWLADEIKRLHIEAVKQYE